MPSALPVSAQDWPAQSSMDVLRLSSDLQAHGMRSMSLGTDPIQSVQEDKEEDRDNWSEPATSAESAHQARKGKIEEEVVSIQSKSIANVVKAPSPSALAHARSELGHILKTWIFPLYVDVRAFKPGHTHRAGHHPRKACNGDLGNLSGTTTNVDISECCVVQGLLSLMQASSHCRALLGHVLWYTFTMDSGYYKTCLNALAMLTVINRDVNRLVIRKMSAQFAQYQFQQVFAALDLFDIAVPFCLDFVPYSSLDDTSWHWLETIVVRLLLLRRISLPRDVHDDAMEMLGFSRQILVDLPTGKDLEVNFIRSTLRMRLATQV